MAAEKSVQMSRGLEIQLGEMQERLVGMEGLIKETTVGSEASASMDEDSEIKKQIHDLLDNYESLKVISNFS